MVTDDCWCGCGEACDACPTEPDECHNCQAVLGDNGRCDRCEAPDGRPIPTAPVREEYL